YTLNPSSSAILEIVPIISSASYPSISNLCILNLSNKSFNGSNCSLNSSGIFFLLVLYSFYSIFLYVCFFFLIVIFLYVIFFYLFSYIFFCLKYDQLKC